MTEITLNRGYDTYQKSLNPGNFVMTTFPLFPQYYILFCNYEINYLIRVKESLKYIETTSSYFKRLLLQQYFFCDCMRDILLRPTVSGKKFVSDVCRILRIQTCVLWYEKISNTLVFWKIPVIEKIPCSPVRGGLFVAQ